ncbi:MAG: integration host factor subunit beta [Gammaproteobacteria bacterium]|nr:integration host factor subunit beta [Gammaproteobacteria bacterium]
MTRSGLIERVAQRHGGRLAVDDVEKAVKNIVEQMSSALARGDRIEIRGFGSFRLHYRRPRTGRNPATGGAVELDGRHVPRFKPGKQLRDCVNEARRRETGGGP